MKKSEGGERTKKKILGVFISLLAVVMLTTPLVVTVHALGKPNKGQTSYTFPFISAPTLDMGAELVPPYEKWVGPDDSFRSSFGAVRTLEYQGALGTGLLTMTTIHGLGKYESPTVASGAGTYNITLDVSGDYGTGRLEGMARLTLWDLDFSSIPPYYELWTMSLHGKGDLKGLNVFVEAYATMGLLPLPYYYQWWNTTIS